MIIDAILFILFEPALNRGQQVYDMRTVQDNKNLDFEKKPEFEKKKPKFCKKPEEFLQKDLSFFKKNLSFKRIFKIK